MVRQTLRPAKQEYTQVDENLFREQITNFINEIDEIDDQYSEFSVDEYENFGNTNFNENIPTTSEPVPPPTLI